MLGKLIVEPAGPEPGYNVDTAMPHKDPEARREYDRKYREEHLDQIKEQTAEYRARPDIAEAARQRAAAWYAANKERAAKNRREYKEKNRDKVNAATRAYRKKNPEKRRAETRKYYETHKEQKAEYKKKYVAANRAKISQKAAEYYQRTKEERQAYSHEWWAENAALGRMYAHERRAREAKVGGRHAAEDAHRLWIHYDKKCAVENCQHRIEESGKQYGYCVDHVMPLSRGGTNDFTNLQILCKSHNSQKKNRTNEEWIALFDISLRDIPPITI